MDVTIEILFGDEDIFLEETSEQTPQNPRRHQARCSLFFRVLDVKPCDGEKYGRAIYKVSDSGFCFTRETACRERDWVLAPKIQHVPLYFFGPFSELPINNEKYILRKPSDI